MRVYRCDVCGTDAGSEHQLYRLNGYTSDSKELATDKIQDACSGCRDKLVALRAEAEKAGQEYTDKQYAAAAAKLAKGAV